MASNLSDTKEQIMTVARHFFARYGYHGTSVDSIVKEANLSKGALYCQNQDGFVQGSVGSGGGQDQGFFAPTEEGVLQTY